MIKQRRGSNNGAGMIVAQNAEIAKMPILVRLRDLTGIIFAVRFIACVGRAAGTAPKEINAVVFDQTLCFRQHPIRGQFR